MPRLKKIVIQDFRNISFQELEFSPNINCISGDNGTGKTNLLEAIYYLSMTKSPTSVSDRYNYRHGTQEFTLAGSYSMESGLESKISINVSQESGKKLKRDDKTCQRISEHIGLLPIVMVSPADTSLVSESGEERRRFANAVLSQLDPSYLGAVQQYSRLLLQRNAMLKGHSCDPELLSAYDERMAQYAEPIAKARREFADKLSTIVNDYYNRLSGSDIPVSVKYSTDQDKAPLQELLAASLDKDMALGFTTAGPQRDDFVFTMDGYPIRRCGSQGQQKSFLVSLKFAQYEIMKGQYGFAPMLLLDDLFDKLDMKRVGNLLKMVAGNDFGQIFITDSNKVRMAALVDSLTDDRAYFDTVDGVFTPASDKEDLS